MARRNDLDSYPLLNGAAIRRARRAAGLSQFELAVNVGVTPQAVQRWESGEIKCVSKERLRSICSALIVRAEEIVR